MWNKCARVKAELLYKTFLSQNPVKEIMRERKINATKLCVWERERETKLKTRNITSNKPHNKWLTWTVIPTYWMVSIGGCMGSHVTLYNVSNGLEWDMAHLEYGAYVAWASLWNIINETSLFICNETFSFVMPQTEAQATIGPYRLVNCTIGTHWKH